MSSLDHDGNCSASTTMTASGKSIQPHTCSMMSAALYLQLFNAEQELHSAKSALQQKKEEFAKVAKRYTNTDHDEFERRVDLDRLGADIENLGQDVTAASTDRALADAAYQAHDIAHCGKTGSTMVRWKGGTSRLTIQATVDECDWQNQSLEEFHA